MERGTVMGFHIPLDHHHSAYQTFNKRKLVCEIKKKKSGKGMKFEIDMAFFVVILIMNYLFVY